MKKIKLFFSALLLSMLLPMSAYALDRFVMGTYGNGIPLSGKTVEEAKSYLEGEYSRNYVLYIKGRDKVEEIKAFRGNEFRGNPEKRRERRLGAQSGRSL